MHPFLGLTDTILYVIFFISFHFKSANFNTMFQRVLYQQWRLISSLIRRFIGSEPHMRLATMCFPAETVASETAYMFADWSADFVTSHGSNILCVRRSTSTNYCAAPNVISMCPFRSFLIPLQRLHYALASSTCNFLRACFDSNDLLLDTSLRKIISAFKLFPVIHQKHTEQT